MEGVGQYWGSTHEQVDKTLAMKYCENSIELDPANSNGTEQFMNLRNGQEQGHLSLKLFFPRRILAIAKHSKTNMIYAYPLLLKVFI
jgi:transketolase